MEFFIKYGCYDQKNEQSKNIFFLFIENLNLCERHEKSIAVDKNNSSISTVNSSITSSSCFKNNEG